jgi:hypothetical protein
MIDKSKILIALDRIAEALENQADPDASLTTEEAARFLKVSSASIRRYRDQGLPYFQIKDHGIRFIRRDLIYWRERYKRNLVPDLKLLSNL